MIMSRSGGLLAGFGWDVHVANLSSRVNRSSWSTSVDSRIHSFSAKEIREQKQSYWALWSEHFSKTKSPPRKNKSIETKDGNLCEHKPVPFKKLTKEFKAAAFNSALKRDDPAEFKTKKLHLLPTTASMPPQHLGKAPNFHRNLAFRVWKDLSVSWNWGFMMLHDQYYGHFLVNKWSMDSGCPHAVGASYRQMWNNI